MSTLLQKNLAKEIFKSMIYKIGDTIKQHGREWKIEALHKDNDGKEWLALKEINPFLHDFEVYSADMFRSMRKGDTWTPVDSISI